ncbi:MAG: DUF115 domain-containing protein [Spirochaetaceae bacterium]|jgi:hypothetical protein|nr:DUF115 domain-containing protein [Spirochaetaceae bacterium]
MLPQIAAARRGNTVFYLGKPLLSRIDPVSASERIVESAMPAKERTLYFCPSPLFGYGLNHFVKTLPENSFVICVEATEALAGWTRQNIDGAIFETPGAALFLGGGVQALCRFVREKCGQRSFRRVEELRLSAGYALAAPLYDEMAGALRSVIALEWGNAMTLTKLGRLYIRNFLKNLHILEASPALKSVNFGERPVLVAGAGPSLDMVLDELLRHPKERLPEIVAVDTALGALLRRKLRPSLVVALEAQHWNLADFCGWGGVPLRIAMDLSALPSVCRFASHSLPYFFWTPWTELRLFERLKPALPLRLPPLGSVGLCATALALALSRGPVVVCGLDFAFSLERQHAKGTPSHISALRQLGRFSGLPAARGVFQKGVFKVVSKTGSQLKSNAAMRRYMTLFKSEFASNPRVFELETEGVSLGARLLSLEAAAQMFSKAGSACQNTEDILLNKSDCKPCGADISALINYEKKLLGNIRSMLTGALTADSAELEALIDEADYLWAHFPECAAAGGRRPSAANTSFLKRIRAELDPMLELLN